IVIERRFAGGNVEQLKGSAAELVRLNVDVIVAAASALFDASPDITAKQAQLLLEVVPTASRLAVLWNPTSAFLHSYWSVLKAAAPKLRVSLQPLEVRDAGEFEAAFDSMTRAGADGLIVLSDTFATFHRARLADLAAKHRLPTVYGHGQYVEAGGLMSYRPSVSHTYPHAAGYVD